MKKAVFIGFLAVLALSLIVCTSSNRDSKKTDNANRIIITNNEFMVNGKKIWINGVNTPWNTWNDFGGSGTYNSSFWDSEFQRLRDAGVNATRVWINCNGHGSIDIAEDGTVNGVTKDRHWNDLDDFFTLAKKHEIYIMATLTSFDHFKTDAEGNFFGDRWRNLLTNKKAESFANNYTIPFVKRYNDNPYLWSIDICNEPEWIAENSGFSWDNISYFLAVNAAAIHENSDVLVTVGLASVKYNRGTTGNGASNENNKVADVYLKSLYNNNSYLDFWSPHYYDWVGQWYGVAHYLTPTGSRGGNSTSGWTGGSGLDPTKPAILGECSGKGTGKDLWGVKNNTIITDYEQAYLNGWQGVMAWTSNGVDSNGDLSDIAPATKNMQTKYSQLVFP